MTDAMTDARHPDRPRPLPDRCCDLVMKGGITSGVVYPMAVKRLSDHYRFQNIGGTSAGAIAAVITAAAEYGRARGGFDKVAALPEDLSRNLLLKFQPRPDLAPLFRLMLAALAGRPSGILRALLTGWPLQAALAALPGLAMATLALAGRGPADWGFAVLGLLLALTGTLAGPVLAAKAQATRDLEKADFGLCPGRTQPGYPAGSGLSDWLARTIDDVAGLAPGEGPLTLGMLKARGITVQTVTTDITTHRPFALPMKNRTYAFSPKEFSAIFPPDVVKKMEDTSPAVSPRWGLSAQGLRHFGNDDLPVVVLARMSLSFPGLISAVPLWRLDHTLVHPEAQPGLRRCLFSDGGVSSNFPVHFFDHLLPHTPTFGISLAEHDPMRVAGDAPGSGRISLPTGTGDGRLLPTRPFRGLGGFVMALFDSAKDWQDSLQSVLTGYRERIVTVSLTPDEGGLNLDMPKSVIDLLTAYGEEAGTRILQDFDLEEHRWRRFLIEAPALERALIGFSQNWRAAPPAPGERSYPDLVLSGGQASYGALKENQRRELHDRAARLAALGQELEASPLSATTSEALPVTSARLRLVATMDDGPDRTGTSRREEERGEDQRAAEES